MEKPLTKQDKVFVDEVIKHGNKTKAAQNAYGIQDPNYAGVRANRMLSNAKIVKSIQTLADRIPDELLDKVLKEGLGATKKQFKNNNSTGEIELVGEEPDYAVRHKYLDSALKIKGEYGNDPSGNVNLLMPVLVQFIDKDNGTSNDSNTN